MSAADLDTYTWAVDVAWTSTRPVIPDEHTRRVLVAAAGPTEAQLVAAQIVGTDPRCEMTTRTTITDCWY